MYQPVISGTGVFTPSEVITNDELVVAFNAYADLFNAENADAIAAGKVDAKPQSSADFIFAASGIERRFVLDREGVLDPTRMFPSLPARPDDAPGYMAEIGVDACKKALVSARLQASDLDLVICAASNLARAYPPPVAGKFNIGVLHTSLTGRPPHADYAPCSLEDLTVKGYDYWALGHVHQYEEVHLDPPVVFPGNLPGRNIREAG